MREALEAREKLTGNIKVLEKELEEITLEEESYEKEIETVEKELHNTKLKKNMLSGDYSTHDQKLISTRHEIESIKLEIEENVDMPNSVKKVLRNTKLTGIHNTIGNILSTDPEYVKALNTAISYNKNFIITKDEDSAKRAISYLKEESLGRATFFPMDVIKERYVDNESLNILRNHPDFVGILSDLVIYNREYESIIKNQLGNIVIATNIDSATELSHKIKARYKIVTLDGDQINVGGSLSGGSQYNSKSTIVLKQNLKHLEEKESILKKEQAEITKEIEEVDKEVNVLEQKLFTLSKEKVLIKEKYQSKAGDLQGYKNRFETISKEYSSLESINSNSVDEKEASLIKLFHEKVALKEQLELKIKNISKEIDTLKEKLEKSSADNKLKMSKLRELEKEAQELEININRNDVKLDTMLETLSVDYELTFERAKENYELDIDPDEAREKVETYRANIKRIGMVNLDAIEEYEKVNTRYEFLTNQREDLLNAEDTLLEIMNEMDEVMKEEFKITFDKIKEEFKKVFKELFKGGTADLRLTDPEDLLTTGVDIVASPPGKKLTTISLLSGGEKTLTAISRF